MLARERRSVLIEALGHGEADVEALAQRFGVSASTVRRDLQQLSNANVIRRTYGGAILAPAVPETSLSQRQQANAAQKAAIAEAALDLLVDGEALILDAGSTVAAFGRLLPRRRHRIVTNSLPLVAVLMEAPGIDLTVLGGGLRPTSMSTIGPLATEAMRHMTADKLFTSADGLVAGRGLCEASLDQIALKSLMIAQAREVVVLADATKLSRSGQDFWAELPGAWTLVTDADDAACAPFAAAGARIVRAAV
jgi:DeoR family transcriptional regulator, fructose operon transcriptional repressor